MTTFFFALRQNDNFDSWCCICSFKCKPETDQLNGTRTHHQLDTTVKEITEYWTTKMWHIWLLKA
jgi:hypothetical protein